MNMNIILASNSPRRRELLSGLGLEFDVIGDSTPEPKNSGLSPFEMVCELAKFKCENVLSTLPDDFSGIVIGADTVVAIDDAILGKPKDEEDALDMLLRLSGNMHQVYTGVCVKDSFGKKEKVFYEKTEVFFKKLDINEIKDYINTGEPMDKAGAYGIQNLGSLFVEKINGDYFNVVGLPVSHLGEVLKKDFDIRFFK